jgi:lipopolysaccharide biosynthesis glycosyltransferase
MSEPVVHVALATDVTYLPWCAVAVLSCQQSTPWQIHAHILHEGDLSDVAQRRLAEMVRRNHGEVSYHAIDTERLAMVPSKGAALGGRTSWIRILLPEMLPGLDRIVYLDADTLTVDSVAPLWTLPLDGTPLAAVSNVVEPNMWPHVEQLGIADPRCYFNAGVLVMNLAAMRDEDAFGTITKYVTTTGADLSWFDQDALNVVFADRWHHLEPRWNAMNSFWFWRPWARDVFGDAALQAAVSTPAIVHFEGPSFNKPWHYLCQHPFRELYLQTLTTSPWSGAPLLERTAATRVIRRLPRPLQLPAYTRLQAARARRGVPS